MEPAEHMDLRQDSPAIILEKLTPQHFFKIICTFVYKETSSLTFISALQRQDHKNGVLL